MSQQMMPSDPIGEMLTQIDLRTPHSPRLLGSLDEAKRLLDGGKDIKDLSKSLFQQILVTDPVSGGLRDLSNLTPEHFQTLNTVLTKDTGTISSLIEEFGKDAVIGLCVEISKKVETIGDFRELIPITIGRFARLGSLVSLGEGESSVSRAPIGDTSSESVENGFPSFQCEFDGSPCSIEDAWNKVRAPVKVIQANGKEFVALPGFGALDAPNAPAVAAAIYSALQPIEDLADERHIIDIGAGAYGTTGMLIVSSLFELLKNKDGKANLTLHLVDPNFDPSISQFGEPISIKPGSEPVELSKTTTSYLPPAGMEKGHMVLRLLKEHPEILAAFKEKGVNIIFHQMGEDEFYEKNLKDVKNKTALVMIDGNHGLSLETGEIQPWKGIEKATEAIGNGQGTAILDDYKATPNCGLVQFAVDILVSTSQGNNFSDSVVKAEQNLKRNLGAREQEWNNNFPQDQEAIDKLKTNESQRPDVPECSVTRFFTRQTPTPVVSIEVKS
jgi:hypothetical protein